MTEIEVYQPANGQLAVPVAHSFDDWIPVLREVVGLAEAIADSPFVPDGLRGSVPAVAAAILTARELGVPPMTGLANIHLIKGKTGLSALLMRALIQSKGHEWVDVEVTDTRVVLRGRRRGEAEWAEASFNRDQARTAGIQLNPYPQDKLYARASVRLARRKFADVIAGMPYSAEELEDGELDQLTEATDQPADPPKLAQRTAQRRQRPPERPTPAAPAAATAPTAGPASAQTAPSGLPPLPGEEDEDAGPAPSTGQPAGQEPAAGPARASSGQRGIIRQHFTRLGFGDDEPAQRLAATAGIAGIDGDLASTNDLTQDQARAVIDTLARCRDRDRLIALLAAGDKTDA